MGRPSSSGGVRPAGLERIQFDFTIDHVRYRPTLPWRPHETNLRRARALLANIKLRIAAGTFDFLSEFPNYRYRRAGRIPLRARTCNEVFDLFLRHEETRVTLGDLAPTTLAAHRQLLNHVWRPTLGALPFLGVRYSQLIAIPCSTDGRRRPITTR